MKVLSEISNRWLWTDKGVEVSLQHRRVFIALTYLILIASAELLTAFATIHGILLHAVILSALLIHSSFTITSDSQLSGLLIVLIIAPLIRILSLTMPFFYFITMIAIVSVPVFIAIFVCIHNSASEDGGYWAHASKVEASAP